MSTDKSTHDGQKVYVTAFLKVYDFWVLTICNNYFWRYPTKYQLEFFKENMGTKHLDIGVGTGYYPAHADFTPKDRTITLMDLNPTTLDFAKAKINNPAQITTVVHDATVPLPGGEKYDSVSLFFLLHCMPGPISRKAAVFANLKNHLNPGGCIYGTTVVYKGKDIKPIGFLGDSWHEFLNSKGIFDNKDDSPEGFTEILEEHFEVVEVKTVGRVFSFKVSKPKTASA